MEVPTPAYAVVGVLPSGLAFDDTLLTITGAPTDQGSGTITVRATNSEGSADWTIAYQTQGPPSFPQPTGPAQQLEYKYGNRSDHGTGRGRRTRCDLHG